MNKFKVKILGSSRLKNNKLTVALAITVASIFLLIFLKAWLADDTGPLDNLYERIGIGSSSTLSPPDVIYDPGVTRRLTVEEAKQKIKLAKSKTTSGLANIHTYRIEQERLLRDYQKTIHLKMNFPGHLHYTAVELEDDIGAILGTTTNLDQSFAVLATTRQVSVAQVLQYLKEESEVFSMVKGHNFEPEKSFKFTPPESTGLGPLTVIPSSSHNGNDLYAVIAPRADKKGNYLFMMEAKKSYFDANEDGFEKLLDGMQTQP